MKSKVQAILVALAASLLSACGGGSGDPASGVGETTYYVAGTVSGLASGASLTLVVNANTPMAHGANGVFTFPQGFKMNAAYAVTVGTHPSGQLCSVTNGSGTISGNVSNVLVACVTPVPL